jgi:hypothetical protein
MIPTRHCAVVPQPSQSLSEYADRFRCITNAGNSTGSCNPVPETQTRTRQRLWATIAMRSCLPIPMTAPRQVGGDVLKLGSEADRARSASALGVVLFVVAALLTVKTALDLVYYRRQFPNWFVPTFVFGTAVLVGYSGYVATRVRSVSESQGPRRQLRDRTIWLLLAASFVSTTGVHGFYPFRPAPIRSYLALVDYPIAAINFTLAALGVIGTVALWWVYHSGRRGTALLGVALLGFLLLVPNDTCKNPFNYWWLSTLGASPLMFVPNMYAAVLALAALQGIHPRLNTLLLAGVCLSTALLGLGHMSRVIW